VVNLSRQDWLIVGALAAAALLIGLLTDALGWTMFFAALAWILIQHREHSDFVRWARKPLARPGNRLESWQQAVEGVYRTIRNSRVRNAGALGQLHALRVVTDALPDAAVIIDSAGNIEKFNGAAMNLLHLDRHDLGGNLSSLIRQPDFVALVRGRVVDDLAEFASPLDEQTRLEARRIDLDQDRALVLVRDVTQLNRLLSMRQEFIANVSHELRTPLTVIVGYLETLVNDPLDQETTMALIDKLSSPTRRMQALVDDLLLLTRLEASPTPAGAELGPVEMASVIESAVADAKVLSAGAHEFRTHIDSQARVLGVDRELHSACLNLVSNAVRYSPDGGAIEVSWTEVPDGARFAVRDHGLGIPHEHLSRLTERFYRVDLARSRVRGGTGLGLAIVKHVLKRHDTELEVDSELNVGSTFFCDFPASRLVAADTSPESSHPSQITTDEMR